MIHGVTSDLISFKSLSFKPGLNIILADRSTGATDRQTRNGSGKSSFVQLVHFLFGADAKPKGIFRTPELVNYSFEIDVDVGTDRVSVTRNGKKPAQIHFQGDTSAWPIEPVLEKVSGNMVLSNEHWKAVLGSKFFGLDPNIDDVLRFSPTFRAMFSYFVRRQDSGAFGSPIAQSKQQQNWDQQVNVSKLLDLDANIPREFNEIRAQERAMVELRKAAAQGGLGSFYGKAADFRTQLAIATARAEEIQKQVSDFKVVPEYAGFEEKASSLTREISKLSDDNTIDHELIGQLRSSIEIETPPGSNNLSKLYEEAGIVLPGTVGRRFDEVAAFHEAIVENRRVHLSSEIAAAEDRITARDQKRFGLDEHRRFLMAILQSGGALEHYSKLQEEVGRTEAAAETLRNQLEIAERIESTKTELDIERGRLQQALQNDLRERQDLLNDAIVTFEGLSTSLYEKAGSLTVDPTSNGPIFEVKIESERSKGITNMQIFCFDLMLAELAARSTQHAEGSGLVS